MTLYIEQIRQLVALQRVDDSILEVEEELKSAPATLEELTKEFQLAEAAKAKHAEKLARLQEQEARVTAEMEEDAARIRKSKSKLMQVANSREYQAMAREMDGMEKILKMRQEERGAITDEIKSHRAVMEETDAHWEKLKADLAEVQANLDSRMAAAQKRLAELKEERAHTGNSVPRPVLERYEFIRRRLAHPVIVAVQDSICSGCHIAIPPQAYIELQGGQKILNCPNCQRLIYWSEHFTEKEDNQPESGE